LDVNINNLLAIKSIIEISYKTEKFDKAYRYLKRFLEIYHANINMLFAMAGIEFKRGEVEDSLQTLDKVLLLDPKHQYALDFQKSVRTVSVE
jgi:tetratricopeptide (TPR) repeat protein